MTGKYADFLLSDEWKDFANKLKVKRGNHCEICGSPEDLNAHHVKYADNLMNEDNILILCVNCHKSIHRMIDRYKETLNISPILPENIQQKLLKETVMDIFQNSFYKPGAKSTCNFWEKSEFSRARDTLLMQLKMKFPIMKTLTSRGYVRDYLVGLTMEDSGVLDWRNKEIKEAANNGRYPNEIQKRFRISESSYKKAINKK